jgi:pantoate--beta-alanine ligase
MRTVVRIAELRALLAERRRAGDRIALVPTMGFLHEGHLTLVDEARRHASCVVMSIFVNPLQFGPNEDLSRYPRDPEGDAEKAHARAVDILFAPAEREVYPAAHRIIEVRATALADRWEGAVRPGHFAGVLTVVAKLFNITQPDVAIFGQKDIQQATLVRAMVRELDFPLEVIVAPTVREPDGLAMSSRNSYLSTQDRQQALVLSRALRTIAAAFGAGERDAAALSRIGQEELAGVPAAQVDYLAIVDPERMEPVREATPGTIVAVAARVGPTRLIDNVILEAP